MTYYGVLKVMGRADPDIAHGIEPIVKRLSTRKARAANARARAEEQAPPSH